MEGQCDQSASIGALAKALAGAQGELDDAKKDGLNPHLKSKYATLASVRAAITPVFSKHGLAVAQLTEPHGDSGVCVVTMLMHGSGEWIRSRLFLPVVKKDPQGFGSAISYARRYALASIAGIASDDDDDGEAASRTQAPFVASPPSLENQLRQSVASNWVAWVDKHAEAMNKAAGMSPGALNEALSVVGADVKRLQPPAEFVDKLKDLGRRLKAQRVEAQATQ